MLPAVRLAGRWNWSGVGLAGAIAAFVGLAALYAVFVPKFLPSDETAHVGYGLAVGHGELPTLDSEVRDEIPDMPLHYEVRREVYTANHPPLYYAFVAVPLRLGVAAGRPVLGLEVARLTTVLLTAIAAVATWRATRLLLPKRRDLAVLAAALALLVPAVPRFSGVVHNDGFGLTVSAVVIAIAVELLVRGPSRRLLLFAAVAASASALTRAIGLGGAGLLVVVAAASVLIHDTGGTRSRLQRAFLSAAAVGGAAFVAAGWFWIRNIVEYGDLTGSEKNLARFGYSRKGSTFEYLFDRDLPVTLHDQLWGRIYDSAVLTDGHGDVPGDVVVALVTLGALILLVKALRAWSAARQAGERPDIDRGRLAAWVALAGWSGIVYVSTVSYVAAGGGVHGRYLFPALPAVAILAAGALGALPGRRYAVAPVAVVVTMVVVSLLWAIQFAERLVLLPWREAIENQALVHNGVPSLLVWSTVVLAILGTAATITAMVALARTDAE
jgi:hypothetical protein